MPSQNDLFLFHRSNTKSSPSSYQSIESGVPEGSKVGPLLFLVFIDDLPNECFTFECLLYADDAKTNNLNPLLLQNDILNIHTWAENNKTTFNLDKTFLIWFTRKNNLEEQPILVFGGNDLSFTFQSVTIWESSFVIISHGQYILLIEPLKVSKDILLLDEIFRAR